MKSLMTILLSLVFSFVIAQERKVISAFAATYDEKVSEKNKDAYIVYVYEKPAGEKYWVREMFHHNKDFPIASQGFSSDSLGMIKEGNYKYYHPNGEKWKEGLFIQNKKEGLWQEWDKDGFITAKENYVDGHMYGLNLGWSSGGTIISDSIVLDSLGNGYAKQFFENGMISGVGMYKNGKEDGEWNYYHDIKNNVKCLVAQYINGEAKSYICFNENAEEMSKKNCFIEREADFPDGEKGWAKYLVKKLEVFDPSSAKMKKGKYSVMLKFIVDKNGEVTDVEIEEPSSNESFNKMALKVIQEGPKWIPAIQYNRFIKAYRRQPITFIIDE